MDTKLAPVLIQWEGPYHGINLETSISSFGKRQLDLELRLSSELSCWQSQSAQQFKASADRSSANVDRLGLDGH
jgi:hypothetical protein